jgi:phosphoribosylaminoimidazole-succinocarboxamide synthase
MQALTSLEIAGLDVFWQGKVRTVYDLGENLLIVASDRISAYDHVLPTGIPDKGKILTGLSAFWFKKLESISNHHMITTDAAKFPPEARKHDRILSDRSMLVRKASRIDVECIVRGHLAGSAWREYAETGRVSGMELPPGLAKNARLDRPLFTPTTKSDEGHDRNITIREMAEIVGSKPMEYIMAKSLSLYEAARTYADTKSITLLDTKFEFGYFRDDIILIDEIFTPDSSRVLARERPGSEPVNLDKQFVRDFLDGTGWDKDSPPPSLPAEVVTECRRRYLLMLEKLTGAKPEWAK